MPSFKLRRGDGSVETIYGPDFETAKEQRRQEIMGGMTMPQRDPDLPIETPANRGRASDAAHGLARGLLHTGPSLLAQMYDTAGTAALGVGGWLRGREQPRREYPDLGEAMREYTGERRPGLRDEPETMVGRMTEKVGQAGAVAAGMAPFQAGAGSMMLPATRAAMMTEAAGLTAGPVVGQGVREAGGPEWAAIAAEVATPVGVGALAPKMSAATRGAVGSARSASDQLAGAGYTDTSIARAGEAVQQAVGPMSEGRRAALMGALDEVVENVPAGARPSPAQVAGGYGVEAPTLLKGVRNVAGRSPRMAARLSDQLTEGRALVASQLDELGGPVSYTELPGAVGEVAEESRRVASGLYDEIPVEQRPRGSIVETQGGFEEAVSSAPAGLSVAGRKVLQGEPTEIVDEIMKRYPDDRVPVHELDSLSSALKDVVRENEGTQLAVMGRDLIDIVEDQIETSWRTGRASLGRARDAWRQFKQTYEPRKPGPRASQQEIANYTVANALRSQKAASKLISGEGRPEDIVTAVRNSIGESNESLEMLRDGLVNFATKEGQASGAAIQRTIGRQRFREIYTGLYGQQAYNDLRAFATLDRVIRYANVGANAEQLMTGSKQVADLMQEALDVASGQAGISVAKKVIQKLAGGGLPPGSNAREIFDLAWTDPEVMRAILSAGEMSTEAWKAHLTAVAGRALGRENM